MSISKRLRYEILRRDNHACRYCGATAPDTTLHVDHVVPTALGGTDGPTNLVAACKDCNSGKSASPADASLVADVASDALRWAEALRVVTERAEADRVARYRVAEEVSDYWDTAMSKWTYKPDDWERSIDKWRTAGLTAADMLEGISIAAGKYGLSNYDKWRYFAGVCNGMIRQRQEAARALLDSPDGEEPREERRAGPELRYAAGVYTLLSDVCDGAVH